MFLGQLYSGIYTLDDTENAEVVKHLYQAIVDLYACVLKLLVISSDLASNTVTQFCHSVFKDEKPAGLILDLANLKNDVEQAAVHCEVTAKALHREELSALFKDTQLLQMQSFEIISEYERKEIRNWVSMVPFGDHHEHIEDRRDKDLGDWLIKHDKFVDWMQSDSVHMLWLQGSRESQYSFYHCCWRIS